MRAITKRTVAFTAAIAGFALIGSGCHANKSTEGTSTATTSAMSSSMMSSSATSSAAASPTSTQIPGANGTPYTVQGPILAKYQSLTESQKNDLKAPLDNEVKNPDGGIYQKFDGGVLITKTGASTYVVWGLIRDAWNANGGSQGKLGYPTSDEVDSPDGAKKSTFEHGTITWKPGDAAATVTPS
jgi:uncharacterized protein with LGFP repeats